MSEVWETLIDLQNEIMFKFEETGKEIHEPGMERFNQPGWVNRVWTSDLYRRAHIDVVDARSTRGLWMMHVCIFPHLNSQGPIYGLDVVSGKQKVTGFFHDYSPTVDRNDALLEEFKASIEHREWKKERTLPDWAKAIFSEDMLAVGNVNDMDELDSLVEIGLQNLDVWLDGIGNSQKCTPHLGKDAQNRYAHYQKQNPHTPKTMTALGLDETDVQIFIENCLFPNIE